MAEKQAGTNTGCTGEVFRSNSEDGGGQLAVSFSGGKDSAVLLYIMAQMWSVSSHKDKPLRVFFSNTTNEFSCAAKYRKEYLQFIKEKFGIEVEYHEIKAEDNYINIVDTVGLPFISKKISRMVRDCKTTLQKLEPNVVKFAFTSKKNGGLGYREVCQFLNDKCGMDIGIPDIEEGYYQKRAQAYEEKNGGDGR